LFHTGKSDWPVSSLFVDQTSMMELRARPAALPVIGRKGWGRQEAGRQLRGGRIVIGH
jgi:hypothetical protein